MSGESPEATWPRAAPPPLRAGTIRARPEDFAVEEMLPFVLSGTGEHQWLQLRKRATNTEFLARQIARVAKVPVRDVGYAGLKDRHAVATQWFSVRLPGRDVTEWAAQLAEHAEVLQATRHVRKLDRGALSGNRFTIVVRDCAADGQMPLSQGIQKIAHIGVPNYFGEQRFGRDADNVARAQAMFAAQEVVRSRHQRGIYLSAARAFLFNTVLARRVTDGSWNALLEGEAVMLAGSRSFFVAETIDDVLRERLDRADVHPSGPLWGRGEPPTRAVARALEEAVVSEHATLAAGLASEGLRQERRALRLLPQDLTANWLDTTTLELRFGLPAGSYATVLLRELIDYQDATRGDRAPVSAEN